MKTCLVAAALAATAIAAHARVTRVVIDETLPLPAAAGAPIAYEQIAGRAYGELDPKLRGNALIQDIELAKDSDGKVRYVATFLLLKPVDAKQASGLMWHDVPNRGALRRPRGLRARRRARCRARGEGGLPARARCRGADRCGKVEQGPVAMTPSSTKRSTR